MTHKQVIARLRKAIQERRSLRGWARENMVSPSHVSRVLSGEKSPRDAVLGPLGIERVVTVTYRTRRGRAGRGM